MKVRQDKKSRFTLHYLWSSLLIRTFLIVTCLIIVPLAALYYVVYSNNQATVVNQISEMNTSSSKRLRDVMDAMSQELEYMAVSLSLKNEVQLLMLTEDPSTQSLNLYSKVMESVMTTSMLHKYVDSIYIYSDKSGIIYSDSENGNAINDFQDTNWYETFRSGTKRETMVLARKRNDIFPYLLSFMQPVYLYESKLGMVMVNVNMQEFVKVFKNNDEVLPQQEFIIDRNGLILYDSSGTELFKDVNDLEPWSALDLQRLESGIYNFKGDKALVSIVSSYKHDWKYISLLPLDYFEIRQKELKEFIYRFIVYELVCVFVMAFFITYRTFTPIRTIISLINNPELGASKQRGRMHSTTEMGYIFNQITHAFSLNRQLEGEIGMHLEQLNKAQTLALQAQINPHFIFNTLETINWKAIELLNGQNDISRMLSELAHMLRLGLDSGKYVVNLSVEISISEMYVRLLKLRYREQFSLKWDIEQKLTSCRILKLSLQPLIENSVYHGIKPKMKTGTILIRVRSVDDRHMRIQVIDSGIGMPQDEVDKHNRKMNDDFAMIGEHIGMSNVNQRIKLIYGKEYGIRISSRYGYWMKVEAIVPITME